MSTFKELQQQSLQQYKTFYDLTLTMERTLEQPDAEEILRLSLELELMEETVRGTDVQLNRYLEQGLLVEGSPFHVQRLEFMQKIVDKNKALSPKIQAMMAMQSSELSKIRQGRHTLGEYASPTSKAGRIINTSN